MVREWGRKQESKCDKASYYSGFSVFHIKRLLLYLIEETFY